MKYNIDKLLLGSIFLHHIYIVVLNTSTLHGIPLPDRRIWTGILLIPLISFAIFLLKEPAIETYEKLMFISIAATIGGTIMRVVGISTQFISYRITLILAVTLSIAALAFHNSYRIRILTFIYAFGNVILIFRLFLLTKPLTTVLPYLEFVIVLGIIYYNYKVGVTYDELFVIIIFTAIGYYIGQFVTNFDVPTLIIGTIFEQTLSLGQYSITLLGQSFGPEFFLGLHLAEVFNIVMIQIIRKRSTSAMTLIVSGIDMTYPPLLGFRSLVILIFLRRTLSEVENNTEISNAKSIDTENDAE